ncbi:hypothetical protein DFH09DRAFT_1390403 [Mycena vulgaris]|nr:hypothetical protein DFH09DRAFT_1390403 [Mycena vulgaris]
MERSISIHDGYTIMAEYQERDLPTRPQILKGSIPQLLCSHSGPSTSFNEKFKNPLTPKCITFSPESPTDSRQDISRWNPPLLGILPVSLFAVLLVLLMGGLEMLNRHSPYSAPFSSMQFFWTYFPVVILMVVEWTWQGWLLDYAGANYFLSIWTAIKYRHIVVLVAKLGL